LKNKEKADSLKPLILFLAGGLIAFVTMNLGKHNFSFPVVSLGVFLMLFAVALRFYNRVKYED